MHSFKDFGWLINLDRGEWSLHPEVLHQFCLHLGTLDMDFLVSHLHWKVPRFMVRSLDPLAGATDALVAPRDQFNYIYAFTPLHLVPCVAQDRGQKDFVHPDGSRLAWSPNCDVVGGRRPLVNASFREGLLFFVTAAFRGPFLLCLWWSKKKVGICCLIQQTVVQAHVVKGWEPPFLVTKLSIREVSTFWEFQE